MKEKLEPLCTSQDSKSANPIASLAIARKSGDFLAIQQDDKEFPDTLLWEREQKREIFSCFHRYNKISMK